MAAGWTRADPGAAVRGCVHVCLCVCVCVCARGCVHVCVWGGGGRRAEGCAGAWEGVCAAASALAAAAGQKLPPVTSMHAGSCDCCALRVPCLFFVIHHMPPPPHTHAGTAPPLRTKLCPALAPRRFCLLCTPAVPPLDHPVLAARSPDAGTAPPLRTRSCVLPTSPATRSFWSPRGATRQSCTCRCACVCMHAWLWRLWGGVDTP
jgi:hypothetical protein